MYVKKNFKIKIKFNINKHFSIFKFTLTERLTNKTKPICKIHYLITTEIKKK